ncbi:MAG: hypothetical protein GX593_09985 [Actinomycetales bacterium]|nr:hypothetical protein [Actinomycetales bacterium]
MSLVSRLRSLMNRPPTPSRVGARRPSSAPRRGDDLHEDALRAILADDPNDRRAFEALASIVRRQAAASVGDGDPLTAELDEAPARQAADLAVWALSEELAGNPRAWLALLELARLSLADDHEGALRRVATAAERDPSGHALSEGLAMLREAGLHTEVLGLGIGHWRPAEHDPEIARHLVLAAIDAGRPLEARQHLGALDSHPDVEAVRTLRSELDSVVAQASQHTAGT